MFLQLPLFPKKPGAIARPWTFASPGPGCSYAACVYLRLHFILQVACQCIKDRWSSCYC